MLKYFIIILFITASLAQLSTNKDTKSQNLKLDTIKAWENETKRIKNPALKKELIKITEEFKNMRRNIQNDFKKKLRPLKIQRDNDISSLKDEYLNRRKSLFEKYRLNLDSVNKKNNSANKKSRPYYNKLKPIPTK